jgi:AcrR family transcriptional regulator
MASRVRGKQSGRRNRGAEVTQAAVEIIYEKGYVSTAIQDVADRVGVLKGSLYHYIDTKEDLLARIFDESDAYSLTLIEESRTLDIPAIERLRGFARAWSLWYLQNIERTSIYVNEWKHLRGERLQKVMEMRRRYEQGVAEMIDAVKEEGAGAPDLNVRYACFFVLGAINGLPTWYRAGGTGTPERIADSYSDLIVAVVSESGRCAMPSG